MSPPKQANTVGAFVTGCVTPILWTGAVGHLSSQTLAITSLFFRNDGSRSRVRPALLL
jgi:hypothetical protein